MPHIVHLATLALALILLHFLHLFPAVLFVLQDVSHRPPRPRRPRCVVLPIPLLQLVVAHTLVQIDIPRILRLEPRHLCDMRLVLLHLRDFA
ncbi:hypothetical protein DFP72DRAFT_907230 [Ephemerocybe angulata]|uniref:Uncharacterized protein n=1 Tax=Ephemerocybe angulata TaxID=980116 RepID=A0A8H6HTG7_9AGAR|nr:hypothetical protein DFP72DRAFT_907230 [Tulosesus angulatus]